MRSRWSAEEALALLAGASLEAAWLTLAYAAMQWLMGDRLLHLGIGELAIGVGVGLLLARGLGRWSRPWFAAALVCAAVLAGIVGVWLAVAPGLASEELRTALDINPGGWLLGLAVLRGTAHADREDEERIAALLIGRGLGALVVFWLFATVSGLARVEAPAAATFAASLTLISAGLLSVGLARLADLGVEAIDQGARRRWLGLLLGVSAGVLALGLPLASLIGVPLATALRGVAGPLGPILAALASLVAAPLVLLLSALADLLNRLGGRVSALPSPSVALPSGFSHGPPVQAPGAGPDLTWLLWVAIVAGVVLSLVAIGLLIPRPGPARRRPGVAGELREAEPFSLGADIHLPRLRLRRPPRSVPHNAVEAYRLALRALVGRTEARAPAETPREHARRIATTPVGSDLGRLAVDYQLAALGGRELSAAEERRSLTRWRRVTRSAR